MDWRSPNRYAYLSEMGGLAAYADLLLPARHGIASPSSMPALWKAKLTDGYTPDSYGYVTYPDSGEAYRGCKTSAPRMTGWNTGISRCTSCKAKSI